MALWAVAAVVMAVAPTAAWAARAALPDGRGYELVSPVEKNGIEVIPQTNKVHVRPDGGAVTFAALGGFGSVEGSAFDFEYLSRRGAGGWSTHGINPLSRPSTAEAVSTNNISTYVDGFAPDLSAAVYLTWRPLTSAPNAEEVANLYRITGIDGGAKAAQLMTDSVNPLPDDWFTFFNNNGVYVRQIQPQFAGVSSDLSHVVFESRLRLTADAPPYPSGLCSLLGADCPTQLYENADGVVRLVGRIPQAPDTACDDAPGPGPACVVADGSQAALSATNPRFYSQLAVSDDGRRIYFQVPPTPLSGALYLREDGLRSERLTADGKFWTASADGSRAFFTTTESLVGADADGGSADLYMYDRNAAGSPFTLISQGSSSDPASAATVLGSSRDGRYVYFVCSGQLIAGEPPAFMGLYVWHDGQLRYVGSFPDIGDADTNGPRTIWSFIASARASRVTPDGRHLLFMTTDAAGFSGRGGFTGYDHSGLREFYLYSADSGRLACASCNPNGRAATVPALIDVRDNAATSQNTSDSAQALTDDGRRVFFNSAEALVPEDTNGRPDAYEYDAQTGTLHLLSSGKSTAPSYFVDATADGDDAFIVTRDQLVGGDIDASYDLYDVRVGGGFPEPPARGPACVGEACLPTVASPPAATPPASGRYRGPGDAAGTLRRHRRCGRKAVLRTVRGKRKCVRRSVRRHARRAEIRNGRSGR